MEKIESSVILALDRIKRAVRLRCTLALTSLFGLQAGFVCLLSEQLVLGRAGLVWTFAEALLSLLLAGLFWRDLRQNSLKRCRMYEADLGQGNCAELAWLALPLTELSKLLGLARPPKLVLRADSQKVAFVEHEYGTMDGATVYFGKGALELAIGKKGFLSILAHELGHIVLDTNLWVEYMSLLAGFVSLGFLTTPMILASLYLYRLLGGGDAALALLLAALTFALLALFWYILYRLVRFYIRRVHERYSDDISALCVGPGVLAGVLIRREASLLAQGKRTRKRRELWFSLSRLFATHPHLFERVERNRIALSGNDLHSDRSESNVKES